MYVEAGAVQHVGHEAVWREFEDSVKRAIFIVDPTQRVLEDGQVVAWDVYTSRGRRSQSVHLQMWRPLRRPQQNRYRVLNDVLILAS